MTPLGGNSKQITAARRNDGQGTCIGPRPSPPPPSIGYTLLAPNERCLEAVVTPLRRRLKTHDDQEDGHGTRELVIGPNPTYPTSQECFECELGWDFRQYMEF